MISGGEAGAYPISQLAMGLWVRVTSNDYARGHEVRAKTARAQSLARFAGNVVVQRGGPCRMRKRQPIRSRAPGAERCIADDAANRDERRTRFHGL